MIEIDGRTPAFAYTVGAAKELDALCAERNVENLTGLLRGTSNERREGMIGIVLILSRWGEKLRAAEEPGYTPQPLTAERLENLRMVDFADLYEQAMENMAADSGRTVRAESAAGEKKTEAGPSP